jgi:amidohydrolase
MEDGPTIALRADMDALPIQDKKSVPYRSKKDGKAHLCGHDAHTSILMGTAKVLTELGKPKRGNIKFIFQPAEEGLAGAKAMMDDGVLLNPTVDAIAALHVAPNVPTGKLSVARGLACAAADPITIKIIGKGGHAARPHESVDSIAISAQMITALQQIISRETNPLDSAVITIGKINGGSTGNAIAPEVELVGTVRTLNPDVREKIPYQIEKVIKGITDMYGADYEFHYEKSYPSVINNDHMTDFVYQASEQILGVDKCGDEKPSMGGEDFAFYSHAIPGVIFRLGVCNGEQSTGFPLHHEMFDLDEESLPIGIAMLSQIALNYLHAKNG